MRCFPKHFLSKSSKSPHRCIEHNFVEKDFYQFQLTTTVLYRRVYVEIRYYEGFILHPLEILVSLRYFTVLVNTVINEGNNEGVDE